MKRLDNRLPLLLAVGAVSLLLAVGCTTRPEPTETLVMNGNHSAADVVMVTADTSSDGYQYLDAELSPDGSRAVFTTDWPSIMPSGRLPDPLPVVRQIAITPNTARTAPLLSLADGGAELVRLRPVRYRIGSTESVYNGHEEYQKGDPTWIDDDHILFWMDLPRGARFFSVTVPNGFSTDDQLPMTSLYREPTDDDVFTEIPNWEHLSPSISPDGNWVAFSRFGYVDSDSLATATQQSLWVFRMPQGDGPSELAFQLTAEAAQVDAPTWSPDGRTIAFHATPDLIGANDPFFTKEIFTVDFDTTGLAADGAVTLNRNIQRLTYSEPQEGSPIRIRNINPAFSPDGLRIAFISDRRAPTLTYSDQNVWWIPSDGSLDPQLLFFTRSTESNVQFTGGAGNEVLVCSSFGFPTELLGELEAQAYQGYLVEDVNQNGVPDNTELQAAAKAAADREELEFFENVMSHLYLISNW